ncbi:cystathionine beta-lyase [Jeotgalibacillus proteolyticus]|uniref:cysteine-S-conjugate beta-lyase n=1 Tax=Jeotgalibacillus proteolyticus TaxID=2082395 RepID=A0A2S5GCI9_9BACL|nr:cystathionine beta-lyase [Jeotgalibacillus proteolyticus]PPA70668.1 cystathionine gamma-synthase [Jeotgalibacillus proteolyticus]
MTDRQFETKLLHQPDFIDKQTGAVNVPLHYSSTFHQESINEFGPFDYSRSGNPTRQALENTIAELENGAQGFAFASGMAAISSAFMLLEAGDHVLVSKDVYGGTFRVITQVLTQFNIDHTFIDMTDLNETARSVQPNTKVIYVETPSNPCLNITDIEGVAKVAKAHGCLTFVDNTFMTPLLQKPLDLGADLVLHSATKFLSGHSDVVAGLAVAKNEELGARLKFVQNSFGSILGVQDCWLLLRGMKTLSVRLNQSSQSATQIAQYLHHHQVIEEVYYPGFSFHDGYPIHKRQATGPGAVLSFRLPDKKCAEIFVDKLKIPVFAVSLGAVESILSYPATMSHAAMPVEEREKRGITDGLLRLSVGLENVDDLLTDIQQALVAVEQHVPKALA